MTPPNPAAHTEEYGQYHSPVGEPSVTAVIPVFNEESSIGDCVASLRAQDFRPLEIIAVDDGSTDASPEICQRLGIKLLVQDHKGPGAARNLGSRSASGDILLFADADMTFAGDYVSKLIAPILSGNAIATCHWNERVSNWDNPWARCQTWFLGNPDGRRQPLVPPGRESVYRAVRKDFFLSSGGFSEAEGKGDDSSVSGRTGVYAAIVPDAVCYHLNISGPGEIFSEAAWSGKNVAVERSGRARRCLSASLIHHNPLKELFKGLCVGARKREPRLVLYAMLYSVGYQYGLMKALFSGDYAK